MDVTFLVSEWQWQDQISWEERKTYGWKNHFKIGEKFGGTPSARINTNDISISERKEKTYSYLENGISHIIGEIVGGYGRNSLVIDCGFQIRVKVRAPPKLKENFVSKVSLGDYIEFKTYIFSEWCDTWEGEIRTGTHGILKKIVQMENSKDLLATFELTGYTQFEYGNYYSKNCRIEDTGYIQLPTEYDPTRP